MNVRGLAVLGGIVALGGWLASGPGVGRGPSLASPPVQADGPPPPIAVQAASVRAGLEHLQARAGGRASLPPVARNPFRFDERQPAPERVTAPPAAGPALSTAQASTVDLRLVGVAEDPGPDGPQRTAVVTGFEQLFFLKAGDRFGGHFRVLAVSADAMQVEDTTTGAVLTLTMR